VIFSKSREFGYSFIPVARGGKNPLIPEWQRYCERLPNEEEAEHWDARYAGCNVGVTLGPASNLVALDLDINDPEILALAPASPVRKRGLKGETRFFRYNPGITTRHIRHPAIDVLSTGTQTVIPPSIHPETQEPYVWVTPDTLFDVRAEDLPDLDLSFLDVLPRADSLATPGRGGRNNTLVAIVAAMRARGENEERIVSEVYEHDRLNHSPRLFTDPTERFRAGSEEQARNNAWLFVSRVSTSLINKRLASLSAELPVLAEPLVPRIRPEVLYPAPRGIMKTFVEACEANSKGRQDALGLAGAIAWLSVLCANRFATNAGEFRVWPNVYVMSLGYSGYGKGVAHDLCRLLLADCGENLLGSGGYRSGSSIIESLPDQQSRLDLIDEASAMLKAMGSKEIYRAEMNEILCQLFSVSNSYFMGVSSVVKGSNVGATHNPCVSILASTTPTGFRESVKGTIAQMGLFPRFLTFFQRDLGSYKNLKPDEHAAALRKLRAFSETITSVEKRGKEVTLRGGNLLDAKNSGPKTCIEYDPIVIPYTPAATALWIDYARDKYQGGLEDPDGFKSAFLNRFAELAAKLSLLDAVSLGAAEVDADNVRWAIDVVEYQWTVVQDMYEVASAKTKALSESQQMLQVIKEKGHVTRTELAKVTQHLDARERNAVLQNLLEAGLIKEVSQPNQPGKPGRPKTVIVFVG